MAQPRATWETTAEGASWIATVWRKGSLFASHSGTILDRHVGGIGYPHFVEALVVAAIARNPRTDTLAEVKEIARKFAGKPWPALEKLRAEQSALLKRRYRP